MRPSPINIEYSDSEGWEEDQRLLGLWADLPAFRRVPKPQMAPRTTPHTQDPVGRPASVLAFDGYLRTRQIIGDRYATPPIAPLVPISRSTLWEWVKEGKFPKPVKLGPKTTGWRVADVRDWLEKFSLGKPVR